MKIEKKNHEETFLSNTQIYITQTLFIHTKYVSIK